MSSIGAAQDQSCIFHQPTTSLTLLANALSSNLLGNIAGMSSMRHLVM